MKVLIDARNPREFEEEPRYKRHESFPEEACRIRQEMPRPPQKRPLLPHERRPIMNIEFDDSDWKIFQDIYGDDDEAVAAMRAIMHGPVEIHTLAYQHMNQIKLLTNLMAKNKCPHVEVECVSAKEKMADLYTPFKFAAPGMDEKAIDLYSELYGGTDGTRFLKMLSVVPDEIPVLSRLIAYESAMVISLLEAKKGEE